MILSQSHPPGSVKCLEQMVLKSLTLGFHTSPVASLPHICHSLWRTNKSVLPCPQLLPVALSALGTSLSSQEVARQNVPTLFLLTGSVTKDVYILPCKLEFGLSSKQFISSKEPNALTLLKYVTFKRLVTPKIFILTDRKQFH